MRAEKVVDLSGETFTVDVIETYVPVSRQPGSPFQVFEIYQDATDLLAQVQEAQRVLAAAVASIMLLIFLLLYLIVRRADQVIARQTIDLQVANTELRRLEQLKSDLTHMIVHDMKSPLTSIMLSAGLLSRVAPLIGKQVGLVERTRRSCQQLLTMISDMLDVTRLE